MTCLLLPLSVSATEFSPWLARKYDIDLKASVQGQAYPSLNGVCGHTHKPACDCFVFLSAEGSPLDDTTAEVEVVASATRYKHFGADAFKLTGRYQWQSDVAVEEPFALSTGLTVSAVTKPALHDLSSFYHGNVEAEAHVAYGVETACQQFWKSRTWAVVGLGLADVGSAWLRGNVVWERNWCDQHRLKLFAHSLWGFGQRRLNLCRHFKGYGSIHHQSVDIGLAYAYVLPYKIELAADYSYRAFARNCPQGVSLFRVSCFYPIGL